MKNILIVFTLFSTFAFSQMPNVSNVWMNNSQPYLGTISAEKMPIKVKIITSDQDKKNDQEYFVSGFSLVETTNTKFEGKLKINKYKAGKKRNSVFGEYELAEEGTWNKKTEKIEHQFIEFFGNWKSYDGALNYPTNWKN